jgi:hypothetical protein
VDFNHKLTIFLISLFCGTLMGWSMQPQTDATEFPILKGAYLGQDPPGTRPQPFGQGILSTEFFWPHSAPMFSLEGDELYFSVFYPKDLSRPKDILVMRLEGGAWTKPQKAAFSSSFEDDCPIFSPDGHRLYFSSTRPLAEGQKARKYDIWFVQRENGVWTKPVNLGSEIVTSAKEIYAPVLTGSGALYFSGRSHLLKSEHDIFRAQPGDDGFNPAEKLGGSVNSALSDTWFYVDPAENYLLLYSGARGRGSGLYVSYKNSEGYWTPRKNMGDIVNLRGVRMPVISPDGKYLFFQGGAGCWWMESKIIEYLRENDLDFTSKLITAMEKQGLEAAVHLFQEFKKQHGLYFDLDEQMLNRRGYELIQHKRLQQAVSIFSLNAALYPDSFNVYDSLGEAYMRSGEKELAIKNYEKSLALNPDNKNAREMLKRLK